MILYIHGFGSSGLSHKATLLKAYFGDKELLAPSLSHIPELAIDTLDGIISHLGAYHDITLMGSSLGGYYASYFAKRYDLKSILINPAVYPYRTLAKNVGMNHSYHDESDYAFIQKHIDSLQAYEVLDITSNETLLFLQTDDEVLDYREALEKYKGAEIILEEGGSHSFENFERHFSLIADFIGRD